MSIKKKRQKSTYEKRKEILDSPYRDGVPSVTGKGIGIRAMDEEEAAFLDKFNSEFGCANISYDNLGLHEELMNKNKPEMERIGSEIIDLKNQLKSIRYEKSGPPVLENRQTSLKKELISKIKELELKLDEIDVVKSIRQDNYRRSNDPLNYKAHHINILDTVYTSDRVRITKRSKYDYASESEIITFMEESKIIKT